MNSKSFFFSFLAVMGLPSFAMDNPYQDVQPMEIEYPINLIQEQPSRVPTLRQLCIEKMAPVLSMWFENYESASKVISLPNDLKYDLWHSIMFDKNEPRFKRSSAIVWLAQASPIVTESKNYEGEKFATERCACEKMSVTKNVVSWYLGNPCPLEIKDNESTEVTHIEFEASVVNAQFSENGKFLFVVDSDKHVDIFRTDTWDSVNSTELHYRFRSPRLSLLTPDNNLVICGSANSLCVYDVFTGETFRDLIRHSPEMISRVKISPDGDSVFVFFADADLYNIENIGELINWIDHPVIPMQQIDISSLKNFCKQIPELTLEQLLALELFHKVAQGNQEINLTQKHIIHAYQTLPDQIKRNLEIVMPNIQNVLGIKNANGEESLQKKRKKDPLNPY